MADAKDYGNRIAVDHKIHFGKPWIAGTRITIDSEPLQEIHVDIA